MSKKAKKIDKEIKFKRRMEEIKKGVYNQDFIDGDYLAPERLDTKLSNQELIDIIKEIVFKESGTEIKGSKQTITDWTSGTLPHLSIVVCLANFFGASVDWMLGFSDNRTAEKQDEELLFRRLGISRESWLALSKNRELIEDGVVTIQTINENDNSSSIDDFVMDDENIIALNNILSDYIVEDGEIIFPVLKGIHKYMDIESQKPSVKVDCSILDSIRNAYDINNSMIAYEMDEDLDRPYTNEEVEKYVQWYNSEEDADIKIESFNPEDDNQFKDFIKRLRIQNLIYNYILTSSKELNIEELEVEALSYLKSNLRNLKIKHIRSEIDKLTKQEEELRQLCEDGMSLPRVIRERENYEEMLKIYEKH